MTRPHLDEVVDRCIEEIIEGRLTIEACLERWPEQRAELEPLLRAALAVIETPVPAIAAQPERRAAFMAMLAETPQAQPRRWFRLPGLPVPSFHALSMGSALPRYALVTGAAAIVFAIVLALALTTGGTTTASAATLTVFAGDVEQQTADGWTLVRDGAELEEGAALRTGADGRALVTFGDGSTASLDPGTEIVLTRIAMAGGRQIEIGQQSGRLWNDVVSADAASYVVRTPHALVEAHGTVFETIVEEDTSVATAEGSVQVVTETDSVDVMRGQVVRATAEAVGQPEEIPFIGEITIRAPFAATVTDRDGAATGILPTGVIFQQVPGVTTTGVEDGPQHIFVGTIEPGVYSLWLRRYGEGDGIVVVETPNGRLNIPVPGDVNSARIRLAIDIVDGGVFMRTLDTELDLDEPQPDVRVVETARSRSAVDLAVAVAERPATEAPATATAEVTRRDDDDDDGRRDDDRDGDDSRSDGGDDRDGDRRGDDRAGDDRDRDRDDDDREPRGDDRTAEPTATPTATPTRAPDRDDDDRRFRSFEERLEGAVDAAAAGDDAALRDILDGLFERGDHSERLDDLADVMESSVEAQAAVIAVVSAGGAPRFAEELPDALERVERDLRIRIERLFAAAGLSILPLGSDDRRDDGGGSRDSGPGDGDRDGDDDDRDGWRWWWR